MVVMIVMVERFLSFFFNKECVVSLLVLDDLVCSKELILGLCRPEMYSYHFLKRNGMDILFQFYELKKD